MNKRFTKNLMAAAALMLFFVAGAQAQILTNYVIQTNTGETVDTVTVNSTTRLYVMPDPVYSPSYNATTNANIGVNETWTWSNGVTKAASGENWIEQNWTATGTVTVDVVEANTTVSCAGSTSTINVEVIDEPTVTYTSVDGSPVFGSAASPFSFCESDGRLTTDYVQAAFTSEIAGNPSYQIQYTITVDTSSDGGSTWSNIAARTQTFAGSSSTQQASNAATLNLTVPTGGFVAIANASADQRPTRFTYTLNGVNDRISRKSDYLTNNTAAATAWSWYDTTAETVVIVVNPSPVTGPIYHISNMWAN